MGLVNRITIFGSSQTNENNSNDGLLNKRSIFVPLKYTKYDPSNTRSLGGSSNIPQLTPPAPEPIPTPTPPVAGAFSNAFSNAFDI